MDVDHRVKLAALIALAATSSAYAQTGCDCTTIVGSCTASGTVRNNFIELSSDTEQCARVDYLVDGVPFVTLIVEGGEQQGVSVLESQSFVIQGCQVCATASTQASATSSGGGLFAEGEAVRLIEVDPVYPPGALANAVEGYVEVSFTVTPAGLVSGAEVVASDPEGVFDAAALAAVNRWRYTANADGESQTMTERLDFTLSNELFSLQPSASVENRPVFASERRRNNCIQEESRYDFGAMIDVSLINACDEPLVVFSCAAGTGSMSRRWVCTDPEQTGTALRASSFAAQRAAEPVSVDDQLAQVGRLELTRAPNSEYWWLACRVDDANCRSDGREWVRSLNRQMASIDPQDRSRARLARSF